MSSLIGSLRTRRLIRGAAPCLVLFCCTVACGADANPKRVTEVVRLDHPFEIRADGQVTVKGEKLRIKFEAVEQDSRCPADVTCVWAGNAVVRLELTINGRDSKTVSLNTARSPSLVTETHYRNYKVSLVGLKPYPKRSTQKIAPADYKVTLVVSKERANRK